MTTPIRAALERLTNETEYLAKGGEDLDRVWAGINAARATLKAESEGPTMAEEALVALDRIQRGDASHGSDDFDLVANALGQLRRWGIPAIPPAPEPLNGYLQGYDAGRRDAAADAQQAAEAVQDPPTPETPAEALAARPLLEQVAAMADCIGANTVGQIAAISSRAAAWLRENPPGQPAAIEPTPPAPEPGELVAWLKEEAEAYRNTCGTNLASQNLDNAATLLLEQGAELAALRGVPVAGISDEHREAVCTAIAEALDEAYDCQRVWSAWSYGTMGPDDFTLTAEDGDRVAEIADAAIEVIGNFAMQTEVTVCEQLRIVKAGIRAGYNIGHHHTVEGGWGDPDEVADDIAQDTLDSLDPLPAPQAGEAQP